MQKILSIFGTRPEAIKMAPVLRELARYPDRLCCRICVTGQHREMIDQVLSLFVITPDFDMNVMVAGQTSAGVLLLLLDQIERLLKAEQPDWVPFVQGAIP